MGVLNQISFAQPWWFFILPILAIWYYISSKKYKSRPIAIAVSNTAFANATTLPWQYRARVFVNFINILAITLLVIALARPQIKDQLQQVSGKGVDIVLSIDISGSMLATDFTPNRLEAAKQVASNFVQQRAFDRIGLVIFSGESFGQCPPTTDHAVLLSQIESIKSGVLEDGTAIGMGLATAVEKLKNSTAKSKVAILLTDGVNNSGLIDPQTALEIAKTFGIKVYTIGVGTTGMAKIPVGKNAFGDWIFEQSKAEIDEDLLKQIAAYTGGNYYRATENESLKAIYNEISKLEPTDIKVEQYVQLIELFRGFLGLGLTMLIVSYWVKKIWLSTVIE